MTTQATPPIDSEANLASLSPLLVAAAVFVCFSPSLDNFFAGDDFSWIFHGLKTMHHPLEFFYPLNGFLRYTELAYFLVPMALFGLSPFPFFFGLVLIHSINAALVSVLITRLSSSRLAGVIGGLFWGLNYKHAEVVLRPYAVADSLALLFGVASLLLVLKRRFALAALVLIPGLFSKENAVVFPVLAVLMLWLLGRRWFARTLPMFAVAGLFTVAVMTVRAGVDQYLVVDSTLLSRFWEIWLTLVGPDSVWIRQVVLEGSATLVPAWLAVVLCVPFAWLLWRLSGIYRYGLLWTCIAIAPSLALQFQAPRYNYVPLVGVAMIFGTLVSRALERPVTAAWARAAVWTCVGLLAAYFVLGITLEEQDMDRHGELHRQAAVSFQVDVAGGLERAPETLVLFLRTPNLELARSFFPPRPWYLPETYKWVFRRSYGVLGLANTYGFVSFCATSADAPALFVAVPCGDFERALESSRLAVVFHDSDTNRFSLLGEIEVEEVRRRALREGACAPLQPGRFDATFMGDQTL